MSRINRRALLLSSGSAVIASMGAATAYATEPRRRDREPSRDLRALIKAHKATYAAFGKAIQERDGSNREHDRASRAEERALLAVCAYPAVREGDRRAKALLANLGSRHDQLIDDGMGFIENMKMAPRRGLVVQC
jgi:mevalonate pyrophosphate decarboxylase